MRRLIFCAAMLAVFAGPVAAAPKVAVSIKPVHSLVAAVMRGVGEPSLIVRGNASPHTYSLKPSDARSLERAALVVWVGPGLETFLVKPLSTLAATSRKLALIETPGLTLLPTREGGAWEADDHDHGHGHKAAEVNTHIWLDPANAKLMVAAVARELAAVDPDGAAVYQANAARVSADLDALDADLKATLAPVKDRPFVVFHDAYAYLENRYGLNAVGAISVDPQRRPSAKRLSALRAKLKTLRAACVFAEPQFEPALVDTIVSGTGAKKGVLDPEGAALADGPDLYPTLLRANAKALAGCLM